VKVDQRIMSSCSGTSTDTEKNTWKTDTITAGATSVARLFVKIVINTQTCIIALSAVGNAHRTT